MIDKSLNPILQNIGVSDMYCTSKLQYQWILALYNFKYTVFNLCIYYFYVDTLIV